MEILVDVVLPLSLAFIMFSLGIGLTTRDFSRIAGRKRAFLAGFLAQIVLLPILTFVLVSALGLSGQLAAGFMLLSFCPGGVTSNVLSKLAQGDVALSVSLTAVPSLLSILTVPLLVAWSVAYFMGADAANFSVVSLGIAMFLITALPVALGMVLKAMMPSFVARRESLFLNISSVLFSVIVVAALAANWTLFLDNVATLGPIAIALVVLKIGSGMLICRLAGLDGRERKTLAIETVIHNGSLGITLAPLILASTTSLPVLAVPSAIYGIAMYVVGIPFVLWMRGRKNG